jgi:hypothetical protein
VQIPGPPGEDGVDGVNGVDGKNAFTNLTASYIQPVVGGTVAIQVVDGTFVNVGEYLHIESGGVYLVTGKIDSHNIVIQNTGAVGNLPPGTAIPNPVPTGAQVTPSGAPGPQGAQGIQGLPGNPGPPGAVGNMLLLVNRAALKAMPTAAAGSHPQLIFLSNPEPGVNKNYISAYADATPSDDEAVIEPNDHLCRYFWYDL